MPASSASIAAAENRLGVPPPMNTEHDLAAPDRRQRELEVGEQRVDVARRLRASPRASCELKSQYGHFLTHHGMCTYSDSGGSAAKRGLRRRRRPAASRDRGAAHADHALMLAPREPREQRAQRLAAMRDARSSARAAARRRSARSPRRGNAGRSRSRRLPRGVSMMRAVPRALGDDRLADRRRGAPAPARRRNARGGRRRPASSASSFGVVARVGLRLAGVARGLHAGRAAERAHADAGIVGQRRQAARARSRAAPWRARSRRR